MTETKPSKENKVAVLEELLSDDSTQTQSQFTKLLNVIQAMFIGQLHAIKKNKKNWYNMIWLKTDGESKSHRRISEKISLKEFSVLSHYRWWKMDIFQVSQTKKIAGWSKPTINIDQINWEIDKDDNALCLLR